MNFVMKLFFEEILFVSFFKQLFIGSLESKLDDDILKIILLVLKYNMFFFKMFKILYNFKCVYIFVNDVKKIFVLQLIVGKSG